MLMLQECPTYRHRNLVQLAFDEIHSTWIEEENAAKEQSLLNNSKVIKHCGVGRGRVSNTSLEASDMTIFSSTFQNENPNNQHISVREIIIMSTSKNSTVSSHGEPENGVKPLRSHPAAYNTLMKCFSEKGKIDEVIRLFCEMKEDPQCNPNVLCYNTLLNCLAKVKRFEMFDAVFEEMRPSGVIPNVSTYNILVKAYCCYSNRFELAYKILDQMSRNGCTPDVITYSTLITGLCKVGRVEEAFSVLYRMLDENCAPNVYTYTHILQGFCYKGLIEDAKEVIELMYKNACPPNTVTYNILVGALCKLGNFDVVESIFEESASRGWKPNITSYHIYVSGLCKANKVREACKQLEVTMLKNGVFPNTRMYNIVIHSLCKAGMLRKAKCMVERRHFIADVVTYNTLINEFYKVGDISEVQNLFARMTTVEKIDPDMFTYTIMIVMLCRDEKVSDAIYLFKRSLEKGFLPDLVSFSALIDGCVKNNQLGEGLKLLDIMLKQGLVPNVVVFDSLLRAYCREGYCCSKLMPHVCNTIDKMLRRR